jgi:hypothetical protein
MTFEPAGEHVATDLAASDQVLALAAPAPSRRRHSSLLETRLGATRAGCDRIGDRQCRGRVQYVAA